MSAARWTSEPASIAIVPRWLTRFALTPTDWSARMAMSPWLVRPIRPVSGVPLMVTLLPATLMLPCVLCAAPSTISPSAVTEMSRSPRMMPWWRTPAPLSVATSSMRPPYMEPRWLASMAMGSTACAPGLATCVRVAGSYSVWPATILMSAGPWIWPLICAVRLMMSKWVRPAVEMPVPSMLTAPPSTPRRTLPSGWPSTRPVDSVRLLALTVLAPFT
ncbi:hypothetical protein D3C81_848270 [compost metagenome]